MVPFFIGRVTIKHEISNNADINIENSSRREIAAPRWNEAKKRMQKKDGQYKEEKGPNERVKGEKGKKKKL